MKMKIPALPKIPKIPKEEMEKVGLIGIVAFIIIFVLLQFGMAPSFRRLGELRKEIVKSKEELKKNEALIAATSQLKVKMVSMQDKLKASEKALPPHQEKNNILQGITNIAYESKVKIIKIEPMRTEKASDAAKAKPVPGAKPGAKTEAVKKPAAIYTEVPIQIEARGGYHALGEFINRIEMADNIMSIGDIEVNANPDDIQNHNARILVVAYLLRGEEQPK